MATWSALGRWIDLGSASAGSSSSSFSRPPETQELTGDATGTAIFLVSPRNCPILLPNQSSFDRLSKYTNTLLIRPVNQPPRARTKQRPKKTSVFGETEFQTTIGFHFNSNTS